MEKPKNFISKTHNLYDYEDKKKICVLLTMWYFSAQCKTKQNKNQGSCYLFHSILYYHPLQLNFLDETTLEEEEGEEGKERKCRESKTKLLLGLFDSGKTDRTQ